MKLLLDEKTLRFGVEAVNIGILELILRFTQALNLNVTIPRI